MSSTLLLDLSDKRLPTSIGNKAYGLRRLAEVKARVPRTWVVPWEAYERYRSGDEGLPPALAEALSVQLDLGRSFAVRSSTNSEDAQHASFAGLFGTHLHVNGIESLVAAIQDVWDSGSGPAVQAYLDRRGLDGASLRVAVLVQEMVTPVYSGVFFSHNPMTGLHEFVIEAVEGEGTALVQDGQTPDRWVYRAGGWVAQPDHTSIAQEALQKVLADAQTILRGSDHPVDLEWVYDGHEVYWVQMRDITALAEVKVYSNRLSRDMMPGMIHPLIWSINVPMINGVWIDLLEEIVDKLPLQPEDLARSFYYRSYFDMGSIGQVFSVLGFPSEGLEMMMGVVPRQGGRPVYRPSLKALRHLPRLTAFIGDKWRYERRLVPQLERIRQDLDSYTCEPEPGLQAEELLDEIRRLGTVVSRAVYLNVVTPLLGSMYLRLLEQQLHRLGVDPQEYALTAGMAELDAFNPNAMLAELRGQYLALDPQTRDALAYPVAQSTAGDGNRGDFCLSLKRFIEQFGHLSDNSNNFMSVPWREQPDLVLRLVQEYEPAAARGAQALDASLLNAGALRRATIGFLHQRVRRYALYRAQVSSAYMYAYGLYRPYFMALARCFVDRGWLSGAEDIFYLTWGEVQSACDETGGAGLKERVQQRVDEMARLEDVDLPDVIYGDVPPPILPRTSARMYGTPTSQGYATGPVVTVRGISDLPKVQQGDVLVVPYSDVGWTPLFARAGAVIAESGGILSHSSIIAREYGIPAVVSVSSAGSLRDGQPVSVNGYTGEIVVLDGSDGRERGDK